jgi:K+-transporting ATPase ATPase C chain
MTKSNSASGLDPDLSPAAALYQGPRVARVRGLPEAPMYQLVLHHIEDRQFGIWVNRGSRFYC